MLAKRLIPCLDVRDGMVVKGVQFRNHEVMGDILSLAKAYAKDGADELVFYDISASARKSLVEKHWVQHIAEQINIPFCVAGGIKTIEQAREILAFGADKVSVNSPALSDPSLVERLQHEFGRQCVVVGIDSFFDKKTNNYRVKQFTGEASATKETHWNTQDWVEEVQRRGCGEIVLNTMDQDGVRNGYDIKQLKLIRQHADVPLVASGGAGTEAHFAQVFKQAKVDAALAASVFHKNIIHLQALKTYLQSQGINVRHPITSGNKETTE